MPPKVRSKSQRRRAKAHAIGMRRAEQRRAYRQSAQPDSTAKPTLAPATLVQLAMQTHGQTIPSFQMQHNTAIPVRSSVPQNVSDGYFPAHRHASSNPGYLGACSSMAPANALSARPGVTSPSVGVIHTDMHTRGWCTSSLISDFGHHPAINAAIADNPVSVSLRMANQNVSPMAQQYY